jgi:hypothetical protein
MIARASAVVVLALAVALPTFAAAQDRTRVDLYSGDGKRQGYAVINRESGRVDFYDSSSRRTGYGQVDGTGRVERFDTQGQRQPGTVLPPALPSTLERSR